MKWSYQRPKVPTTTFQKGIVLAALFVLSAASLAFEVSLTRLFSYLFVKSYVYILISLSVAGGGFGAVLTYYVKTDRRHLLTALIVLFPPIMLLLLYTINSMGTVLIPSLIFTFLVFFAVGVFQVLIFQESGIKVSALYAADLSGASVGSLLSFLALNAGGAVISLALAALLLASAGLVIYFIYYRRRRSTLLLAAGTLALALASFWFGSEDHLLPTRTWQKEMTVMLNKGSSSPQITETRWSAFGRVDLVETENPLFKTMFIDGAAGTKMVEMSDGQVSKALANSLLLQYMGGIPLLVTEEKDKELAAVIGSGGGIDVVTLLLSGFKQIDAIEINPDFIDVVRSYDQYTGGIYNEHPRVAVYEDEGRSFLRSSEKHYNTILMGLPIIKSARNFSNHSLSENYLFTTNAFNDYLNSLAPKGSLIIITHYPNELLRLVSNAVTAFGERGISHQESMQRIISIGTDRNPTLIIKNDPFTAPEIAGFQAILDNMPVRGSTNFIPGQPQRQIQVASSENSDSSGAAETRLEFHPLLVSLSQGDIALEEYIQQNSEDISAVHDDSPFFYRMEKGLPAELLLVAGTVLLLLLSIGLLFTYKNRAMNEIQEKSAAFRGLISFGLIGFGYMLVEIGVLQKFIIFWHHQTLALTVVLSVILVSSGIGSLISARINTPKQFALVAASITALAVTAAFLLGPLLIKLENSGTGLKLILTIGLTAPLFLPMGVPFPFLLRSITSLKSGKSLYPWMIGFNSITSLGGGVLAMIAAMSIGYTSVTLLGAACYLTLALLALAHLAGNKTVSKTV